MAVTDLTNTKWLFDVNGVSYLNSTTYNITFTSNNEQYTSIKTLGDAEDFALSYDNNRVYYYEEPVMSNWTNEAYCTIEITGGTDVTNATLISWLTANATQVLSTVSIVLGNNTLNGVDTIKITDATDTSSKLDFVYGVTPSTTTSIKIGNTTLTGVNQVNVMGTDSSYKSFGYQQASLQTFTARQSVVSYGPYQFEQGMTFAQWVASAYNTDGWTATEYAIVLNGFYFMKGNSVVRPSDLVEAIQYYLETDN